MDRNARIAYNTLMLYIRTFIVMIIGFIVSRVMLQQLGIDDYGLNNLISGVVTMFGFLNMTMGTAVQRFFSVEEAKEDGVDAWKIFGSATLIHLIIAGVTLLILEIFAWFFLQRLNIPEGRETVAQWVFQFASLNLVMGIVTVPAFAYLRAKEEFSKVAIVDIVEAICRLGILYLLIISPKDKLWTLSFLTFVLALLYNASIWIIAVRKYGKVTKPHFYFEKGLFKSMISFSLLLLLSIASSMAYWQGLVMMINVFFGVAINAAYGISDQLRTAVNRFLANFKQSIVPQLMSSQAANEKERLYKLIYMSTKITFVLSLLIAMPLMFEADFILKVWLKTPPDFTTRFVQLAFVSSIISSFSFFIVQAIQSTGKVKGYSVATSCSYFFCLALIFVLLKLGFSFYFTMYASILLAILEVLITLYFAKKTFDFNVMEFITKIVSRCLMFCAFMIACFLIINSIMNKGWLRLCVSFALSGIVSMSSIYLLLDKIERNYVFDYVYKFISKINK